MTSHGYKWKMMHMLISQTLKPTDAVPCICSSQQELLKEVELLECPIKHRWNPEKRGKGTVKWEILSFI